MVVEQSGEKQIFLATTALEEFWDTSRQIVFLGEWCKKYSRRQFWGSLSATVLGGYLRGKDDYMNAYNYVNRIYKEVFPAITKALNTIHKANHDDRFWQIVIGIWLYTYISVLYDRYASIKKAINEFPSFTTILLSKECFRIPNDTSDFCSLFYDDVYNLQLFTKIINAISERSFPIRSISYEYNSSSKQGFGLKKYINYLSNLLRQIINKLTMRYFQKHIGIVLHTSFFYFKSELKLLLKSFFKIRMFKVYDLPVEIIRTDHKKRSKLKELQAPKDEFVNILLKMLPYDIPKSFVENYQSMIANSKNMFAHNPKGIFTGIGFYEYDDFKYWVASSVEGGVLLLVHQHGGNYGIDAFIEYFLDYEIAISDYYYVWGKKVRQESGKVIPMVATKLIDRKRLEANDQEKSLLYVATSNARYLYQFHPFTLAHCFNDYYNWQIRFLKKLKPAIQSVSRVRPHKNDHEWEWEKRWQEEIPQIAVEFPKQIAFSKSIERCRLYVCDHLGTTFLEALALNKPTVLFWDADFYALTRQAEPYFKSLRSFGILYHSPEEAADAINAIYNDIEGWWNEPKRQKAVREFCDQYVKTSPKALEEWLNEFNRILNNVQ